MNDRRVVITGTGVLSCIGNDSTSFWNALTNGECGIDTITNCDLTGLKTQIAGEVKNFNVEDYIPLKEAKRLDRFSVFAIAASDEAVKSAGLTDGNFDPNRFGCIVSSGIGGLSTMAEQHKKMTERGPGRISPFLIPMMIIDMNAGNISMRYNAKGPNMAIVSACSTATHSIGEAFWMLKRDDADIMLCGGSEASIIPLGLGGFCSMKAMSVRNDSPKTASRPFDAERDGFVMSEGAGLLVLEDLEHAKARGANILAEIIGYGATGDAYHITSPDPEGDGLNRALKMAMGHAKVNAEDIDYINAHGTSTPLNDKFETMALKKALGDHAYKVAISSTKGHTGHGLGAAGGFETIACANAIQNSIAPPTINYENPDPLCDLDYIPNTAREMNIDIAVNLNLGFGGHNGALILKKYTG